MIRGACLVGQSGGPTAVINASLEGIVEEALKNTYITKVLGSINGVEGILAHQIIDFSNEDTAELSLLKYTPSSILGSVRYKLSEPSLTNEVYQKILQTFEILNIRYFFYIGGNDSMDTVKKLNDFFILANYECKVLGVPKTIDNDLAFTDHTPGYGSSIKYIATAISQIKKDIACYKKGKVTVVEIMGRDAGWLTAGAKLAEVCGCGPDLIYLPEIPFNIDNFVQDVERIYTKNQHVLICVSEGIKNNKNQYILQYREFNNNDDFGHIQLGGVGQVLVEIINQRLSLPVRSIELNLPQRCFATNASKTDIIEAYESGRFALLSAIKGNSGKMVIFKRTNNPYHISFDLIDLELVANKVKTVPLSWINEQHNNLTDCFINYALPLIKGESEIPYVSGLPRFAKLKLEKIKIDEKNQPN